jgi:hypothetical protein
VAQSVGPEFKPQYHKKKKKKERKKEKESFNLKIKATAGHQWLMPVILATQEAEIRRITVQSQPWQIVYKTQS